MFEQKPLRPRYLSKLKLIKVGKKLVKVYLPTYHVVTKTMLKLERERERKEHLLEKGQCILMKSKPHF